MNFIATSYKVPVLAEVVAPVPDVAFPAGAHTARQLLDAVIAHLPGYSWKDEGGVAHIFQSSLQASAGNILNLSVPRYSLPDNVWDFNAGFRSCLSGIANGYGCVGGPVSELTPTEFQKEQLPNAEAFHDVEARFILLKALQANGRFYLLISYPSVNPSLKSNFALGNWFIRSLVPDEPVGIQIQDPAGQHK